MRLGRYLAHAGVASRRAAEEIVRAGRVTVDGESVRDPARDVDERHAVAVDGRPLAGAEPRVVIALHKPTGVVSTARDTHGRPTVVELVGSALQAPEAGRERATSGRLRVYPVGRLDVDTSGLILLTNDGELANALLHPSRGVPRTYVARVGGGPVHQAAVQALRSGVRLDDGPTAPARVRRLGPGRLELTVHEGRKRQVRRMCEAVGHPVLALSRTRFGPLSLGGLRAGESRVLSVAEVERLRRLGP
ncbi:MAG: rRNA pseudouridine synthase [Actinobacteria bacterium]|nr:MAG: rRNA pseudouridine synthase [Actinomycetota bacterium]